MEEKLVHSAFSGTTQALFRPTNLLFTNTTNNTAHPQTFCDGKEIYYCILIVLDSKLFVFRPH